jgi:hypothetical protein
MEPEGPLPNSLDPSTGKKSWDSSVGIATGYRLEGQGSNPSRDMIFSLLQTRTHPSSLLCNSYQELFLYE